MGPKKGYTEIEEYDQANNIVATYIQSPVDKGRGEERRIDVVVPRNSNSYARSVLNAFLPAGYPHSVTSDYLEYQIYDSLQAFSSSIAGLLSSRAVLEGLGVGDVSASPTSALLLSVLQESMGRIATILFAHRLGTSLEPECKMYRLLADVFNDAAMVLDCLSPAFPKLVRVGVLGGSSCLRALCGVAAGSSKASLSAHFATQGNLGELNAKDSSQETVISLLGMLIGSLVVSHITSKSATWVALVLLLSIHLGTNYLAVRAVCMRTLNRQRANLVFNDVLDQISAQDCWDGNGELKTVVWPSPEDVRVKERVFEKDGVLRYRGVCKGYCRVGVSFQDIITSMHAASSHKQNSKSSSITEASLERLLGMFEKVRYVVWYDAKNDIYLVVLKEGAGTTDVLEAWMLAVVMARRRSRNDDDGKATVVKVDRARAYVGAVRQLVFSGLEARGWDLQVGAMETRSGCRIRIKELA